MHLNFSLKVKKLTYNKPAMTVKGLKLGMDREGEGGGQALV